MIHSLSGGVIKSAEKYTFIKICVSETNETLWLVCDDASVEVGNTAVFEDEKGWLKRGKVVRVDKNVSGQTPPVPVKKIKTALKIEKF